MDNTSVIVDHVCYNDYAIHHHALSSYQVHISGLVYLSSLSLSFSSLFHSQTVPLVTTQTAQLELVNEWNRERVWRWKWIWEERGEREHCTSSSKGGNRKYISILFLPLLNFVYVLFFLLVFIVFLSFLFPFSFLVYHHLFPSSPQFSLYSQTHECVEFVSLEEGTERMSKDGIEGETGHEF